MSEQEAIGFCWVQVYCIDCGYKEGYNGCKPLSQPSKCRKCGGTMVHTEQEAKSFKELINLIEKSAEKMKGKR